MSLFHIYSWRIFWQVYSLSTLKFSFHCLTVVPLKVIYLCSVADLKIISLSLVFSIFIMVCLDVEFFYWSCKTFVGNFKTLESYLLSVENSQSLFLQMLPLPRLSLSPFLPPSSAYWNVIKTNTELYRIFLYPLVSFLLLCFSYFCLWVLSLDALFQCIF